MADFAPSEVEAFFKNALNDSPTPDNDDEEEIDDEDSNEGGWKYNFVDHVDDDMMCAICLLPFRDPVQIVNCGHSFCRTCITKVLNGPVCQCPLCNQSLAGQQMFPDKRCSRKIQNFKVTCDGCGKILELVEMESRHRNDCEELKVPCPSEGCKVKVKRKFLPTHLKQNCNYRITTCPRCLLQLKIADLKPHVDTDCPENIVPCGNNCGMFLPRKELEDHKARLCSEKVLSCPFQKYGCSVKVKKVELDNHIVTSMADHLGILCQKIDALEAGPSQNKDTLETTVNQLKQDNEKYKEDNDKYKQMVTALQCQVSLLTTHMVISSEKSDVKFLWQVKNWAALKAGVSSRPFNSATSDDFFSGQYGYRMRARVYPGGVGNGQGTHLSALLKLYPGPFDDLLPWPFCQDFSMTVMNVKDKNLNQTFFFKPPLNPRGESFVRPVNDKDGNIGSGKSKFVPYNVLEQPGFVVNDCLTVVVKVSAYSVQI